MSLTCSAPKGRTGELAAADAARMGGALDECHQVFARAKRALSELYPVLVAGRRKVDDLNHAYPVLTGPANTYDGALAAAFPGLARPQQLFVAEDALRAPGPHDRPPLPHDGTESMSSPRQPTLRQLTVALIGTVVLIASTR